MRWTLSTFEPNISIGRRMPMIVLENPAEFNVLDIIVAAAASHFLDKGENHRAARRLTMQCAADTEERQTP